MSNDEQMQRDVASIALDSAGSVGFALAGSGAIREHGLTHRPTADIDLFTVMSAQDRFTGAVDEVVDRLRESGYGVEVPRRSESFARLSVTTEDREVDVDLGIDWRSREPVALEVGPVLAIEDAVGNKVAALYSRGEARDYLDVDAIRASGRFTDDQLVDLASNADPGFDADMFAQQLQKVERIQLREVSVYGVNQSDLAGVVERSNDWARALTDSPVPGAGRRDAQAEQSIAQAMKNRPPSGPKAGLSGDTPTPRSYDHARDAARGQRRPGHEQQK
ncbi:nucleotidyl transferase AbiEii/AbiGii toxin family protein (plasmid) [Bacillus subtilis]|nr:nucleotidyl transferase AbiEii/AbiGii toxin family protein [Bacillus subtilis]